MKMRTIENNVLRNYSQGAELGLIQGTVCIYRIRVLVTFSHQDSPFSMEVFTGFILSLWHSLVLHVQGADNFSFQQIGLWVMRNYIWPSSLMLCLDKTLGKRLGILGLIVSFLSANERETKFLNKGGDQGRCGIFLSIYSTLMHPPRSMARVYYPNPLILPQTKGHDLSRGPQAAGTLVKYRVQALRDITQFGLSL